MNTTAHSQQLADRAATLDADDVLHDFRSEFHLPVNESGKPEIYFVGNSLGLQPKLTESYVQAELELRKFVPHRYLAYATLILVAIHVYLNGGRLLRYLRDRLDKQRPE